MGGGQGSISSDGRTSWDSGCPAPPSTHTSHSLPESSVPSTTGCPTQPVPVSIWGWGGTNRRKGQGVTKRVCVGGHASPWHSIPSRTWRKLCAATEGVRALGNLLEGLWSPQDQPNPGCTSISRQRAEPRRSSSSRSPRSKARGEGPNLATSLYLDLTKVGPAD